MMLPRLPILSWQAFQGERKAGLPCFLDQREVWLTTSGRASILLAMELLKLKPGDKVLVPTYHCPTMIAPVEAVGAEPVFYPIDEYGGARLDWLEHQPLRGVKAILAAHYFGLPQPMRGLRAWCDAVGLVLIEDCAHSLFGISDSRPVGQWGDIAIGSLTKFLPVPEGGCLRVGATRGPVPALIAPSAKEQVKAFVDTVHVSASFGKLFGLGHLLLAAFSVRQRLRSSRVEAEEDGHQKKWSDLPTEGFSIDATLAHRRLTWFPTWMAKRLPRARMVEQRRRNFAHLARLLADFEEFRPLCTELPDNAAPYVFPLWVADPDPNYADLRALSFPVSRWDRLWPGIPQLSHDSGVLWSHHVLQLACHQDLDHADIQAIASTIIRLYAKGKLQTVRTEVSVSKAKPHPGPGYTGQTIPQDGTSF